MTKQNSKRISKQPTKKRLQVEPDGVYVLKLVMYLIVGSQWLRLTHGDGSQIPLPVGLIIGLLFIRHEHFQIDRKVEYAVLLVASLIGFYGQVGVFVRI